MIFLAFSRVQETSPLRASQSQYLTRQVIDALLWVQCSLTFYSEANACNSSMAWVAVDFSVQLAFAADVKAVLISKPALPIVIPICQYFTSFTLKIFVVTRQHSLSQDTNAKAWLVPFSLHTEYCP